MNQCKSLISNHILLLGLILLLHICHAHAQQGIDPTFGVNGKVKIALTSKDFGDTSFQKVTLAAPTFYALSDGSLIISTVISYTPKSSTTKVNAFAIFKYKTDGSRDTTFSQKGMYFSPFPESTVYKPYIVFQTDSTKKLVLSYSYSTPGNNSYLSLKLIVLDSIGSLTDIPPAFNYMAKDFGQISYSGGMPFKILADGKLMYANYSGRLIKVLKE